MGNPVFSDKAYSRIYYDNDFNKTVNINKPVVVKYTTIGGAVKKTIFLLLILTAVCVLSYRFFENNINLISKTALYIFIISVSIISGIIGLVITYNPKKAQNLAVIYTIFEGLSVGLISFAYEQKFSGIIFQAFTATIIILFIALILYYKGIVKVTKKFKSVVIIAGFSLLILYLIVFLIRILGGDVSWFYSSGPTGLLISGIAVIIASAYLFLDFDFIAKCSINRAPKYMEWYIGFGLMLSLIWLYLELLRMLAKRKSK